MTERPMLRPPLTVAVVVQVVVVALGIVLWMTLSKPWILVAGIGAFGPGILRELGVMRDLDEFQRRASHRAAFHAYLVGGLAIVCVASAVYFSGDQVLSPGDTLTILLALLWMTWLFSYLMSFWGPQTTATVVLLTFGAFWALFSVLSGIGEGGPGIGAKLVSVIMHLVFVIPFFVGSYAAHRWPRVTGWALVAVSVALVVLLAAPRGRPLSAQLAGITMLVVPLAASAVGLVREDVEEAEEET